MEAVCTQCQMRYEVGEELLQQGTPILCPTCQVGLTMVHPGTTIPLDQPLPDDTQEADAEPPAEPGPESQSEPAPEPQETPAAESTEPAPGWDSGDLLGAPVSPEPEPPQEEPASAEPEPPRDVPASSSEELSGWGEPMPQPEALPQPEAPAMEPLHPESQAYEALDSQPAETAPDFPEPEVEPELPAEQPAQGFETPAWDDAQDAPQQSALAESAPAPEEPVAETPPEAQPQPEPAATAQPEPAAPAQPAGSGQAPGPTDDWASAAARWAASGFSTENMPDFVRAKEEGQAGGTALVPPAGATFTPPSQPPAEQPAIDPQPPFAGGETPAPAAGPAQPAAPQQSQPAAPPPLPTPGPPPLEGRQRSVYVMKGSGEGIKDESAPWAQAPVEEAPTTQPLPVSAPAESPARAQLDLSAPMVEPATPAAPGQVEVPKPSRAGLWIVLAVILIGAGGYLAYHFVMKSRQLDRGASTADKVDRAGVADKTQEKPKVPDAVAESDAGQADAGKQPETAGDQKIAKKTEKKPPPEPKKPPRRKKIKKKPVSPKETAKLTKKKALEYYKKGNDLIRKRKYPEAIKLFRQALKANPKLAQAHRGLGICYAQRRQNKKACREYRVYLKMIPPDSKEVPALRQILKGCK